MGWFSNLCDNQIWLVAVNIDNYIELNVPQVSFQCSTFYESKSFVLTSLVDDLHKGVGTEIHYKLYKAT